MRLLKIAFVLIIFLIILFFLFLALKTKKGPRESSLLPTPTPFEMKITPSPRKKIIISGIEVNDFLKDATIINSNQDAVFEKNQDYEMVYLPKFNQFLITILSKPFDNARKDAEEDFIKKLGISKEEACRLEINLSVPCKIDLENCGTRHPLSFCEK